MTDPIDEFLAATDLDALRMIVDTLPPLSELGRDRIVAVVDDWQDGQALSNLLFYPDLMPMAVRHDAIERALFSFDHPYYSLAAVVGLQSTDPQTLADDQRRRWFRSMLNMLRSPNTVLAGCASMTLDAWADPYNIAELSACVPLRDEIVHTNILAVVLRMFGDRDRPSFIYILREMGLGDFKRKLFLEFYDTYQAQAPGSAAAVLMTSCQNIYVPTYAEYIREH